ncbi:MAG: tetratricopeptide repeat protein [Chloroflexia bacterium]
MVHPETFAQWLKKRRRAVGLTQEELADRIGCSPETIRKFEKGTRRPSKQMAELIAEAVGVPREDWPDLVQFARVRLEGEELDLADLAHVDDAGIAEASPRERTNLLTWPTSFIGRDKEQARLAELLMNEGVRLLTLTGPPGIGKSRLSFKVAYDLLDNFRDGVFWVPLSPVTDPSLVLPAVTQALKVKETPDQGRLELLKNYLREKQMLLLLDNFEHVVEAGPFVADLAEHCPELKVMVSSRSPLNLYGEHEFEVPPLDIPDPEDSEDLESIAQCAAIELFVQRSRAVNPAFELTERNALVISEICRQLDGLPLAIELAGARSKVLTPQAILARLSNRLKLLTHGPHDLPARQQTLKGAIDWSYDLLGTEDRVLFRRMSAFVGPTTLDSVEGVCLLPGEPADEFDALDGVDSLLGKSLLKRAGEAGAEGEGEPRIMMLWTIREYATERLAESGEEEAVRRQHAVHFLRLAEAAEPHLTSGRRGSWMDRLGSELNNLRAALEWCRSEAGDQEMGLRLAGALGWFWYFRGYYSEARRWLAGALERAGEHRRSPAGAHVLYAQGKFAWLQGDRAAACELLEECAAIWQELGDNRGVAYALLDLGIARFGLGDRPEGLVLMEESIGLFRETIDKWGLAYALYVVADTLTYDPEDQERSVQLCNESLALFRGIGDRWGVAQVLDTMGAFALEQGDYPTAQARFEEALALQRAVGDKWSIAYAAYGLGDGAQCQDDLSAAAAFYAESLALFRELGDKRALGGILRKLAHVARRRGDYSQARRLYSESLELARERGGSRGVALCLAGFAELATAENQPLRAATLFGAVEAQREEVIAVLNVVDRLEYERGLAALAPMLDGPAFQAAWDTGRAMTLEAATAYALDAPV